MIVYSPVLTDCPLLDEQYMLKWMGAAFGKASNRMSEFMSWKGPDTHDAWGFLVPLNLLMSGGISDVAKFFGILNHWLNSVLTFLVARRLTITQEDKNVFPLAAIFATMIFAVYPLAPEAVSWLGGRGCVMGVTFFLFSFWVYLYGRQLKTKEELRVICVIASVLSFLMSVCCDLGFWSGVFAFIGFEIAERITPLERVSRTLEQTMKMMGAHCAVAFFTLASYISSGSFGNLMQPSDFVRVLFRLACPVSNINTDAGVFSTILLCTLLLPTIALVISAKTSAKQRRLIIFAVIWLVATLISNANQSAASDNLYGARWLYFSSVPLCLLMGAAAAAATTVTTAMKPVTTGVSIAFCAILCISFTKLTWTQTQSYRQFGEDVKQIQKGAMATASRLKRPFAIVSNVPPGTSVVPVVSAKRLILLDSETGLVRAYNVPPGYLKDCWQRGEHTKECVTWSYDKIVPLPEAVKAAKQAKLKPAREPKGVATGVASNANEEKPLSDRLKELMENVKPGVLGRMPLVAVSVSNRSPSPRNEFKDLCFDYPNVPELGMFRMFGKHNSLRLVYDATAVAGARKVLIEVSKPNRFLEDGTDTELSPVRYRTTTGSIPKSEKLLRAQFFPGKGVYEIRMIACDKKKKPLGRFADAVNVQLTY